MADGNRFEFVGNVQKFAGQLSHAIQQVNDNIKLPLPESKIDTSNPRASLRDPQVVSQVSNGVVGMIRQDEPMNELPWCTTHDSWRVSWSL